MDWNQGLMMLRTVAYYTHNDQLQGEGAAVYAHSSKSITFPSFVKRRTVMPNYSSRQWQFVGVKALPSLHFLIPSRTPDIICAHHCEG